MRWRKALDGAAKSLALSLTVLSLPSPASAQSVVARDGEKTVFTADSAGAKVSVIQSGAGVPRIEKAGRIVTYAGDGTVRRAHYPFILAPEAKRALVIGPGNGEIVGVALSMGAEDVAVVAESRAMADAAAVMAPAAMKDKRVKTLHGSAAKWLKSAKGPYDVIVAGLDSQDTLEDKSAITVESFAAMKGLLKPAGIAVQWIHLSSLETDDMRKLAASFAAAFPYVTVWSGDMNPVNSWIALTGSVQPLLMDGAGVKKRLESADRIDMVEWNDPYSFLSFYINDQGGIKAALDGMAAHTAKIPSITSPSITGESEEMRRSADNFAFWMNYRSPVTEHIKVAEHKDTDLLRTYFAARSKILNGRKIGLGGAAADEISWYDKALKDAPGDPHLALSYLAIGLAYYRGGLLDKAAAQLEKAKKIAPDRAVIRFYLGKTYEKMEKAALANAEFAELKKLAPDYVERMYLPSRNNGGIPLN